MFCSILIVLLPSILLCVSNKDVHAWLAISLRGLNCLLFFELVGAFALYPSYLYLSMFWGQLQTPFPEMLGWDAVMAVVKVLS